MPKHKPTDTLAVVHERSKDIRKAVKTARRHPSVSRLANGALAVQRRWGPLLKTYRGDIPLGLILVRVWHETRGNPNAKTKLGEAGLLQVWAWLQKRYGIESDPFAPAENCWAGLDDWNARAAKLYDDFTHFFVEPNEDFWACTNLTMSIGAGATSRLIRRVRGGFSAILRLVTEGTEDFVRLPQRWWGSQSHALVAKRIVATAQWLKAAEKVTPFESTGFGREVPKFPPAIIRQPAQWQTAFVLLDFDLGPYGPKKDGVDGAWGKMSQRALERYQRRRMRWVSGERDLTTELMLLADLREQKIAFPPVEEVSA